MRLRRLPKDVFVIHTESTEIERQYFAALQEVFAPGPLSMWNYDDWSWERWQRDVQKKVYRRSGLEIDPLRFALRDPKPFVSRGRSLAVARASLRRILQDSSVVIFVEPTAGMPSQGVELEFDELRRVLDNFAQPHPRPATIQVALASVPSMLTYASAIDRTRWRTCFYLGLLAGSQATAAQLRDFAAATALVSMIAHFMNRMPHEILPALAHRILLKTIERAAPIDVFGEGIQDQSYLSSARAQSQELDEARLAQFRESWSKLMSFASKARQRFKHLEAQLDHRETEIGWPFLYRPKKTSCRQLFEHLRGPFDKAVTRAAGAMEEELARQIAFTQAGDLYEVDLRTFEADSLEKLSRTIQALPRPDGCSWDNEVASTVGTVFGWCRGGIPPPSLAAALTVMSVLDRPPEEVRQVVEASLTFAYAVLKRFRYLPDKEQPVWYSHFFGEAIIELISIMRIADRDLIASSEFRELNSLVGRYSRGCIRWSNVSSTSQ